MQGCHLVLLACAVFRHVLLSCVMQPQCCIAMLYSSSSESSDASLGQRASPQLCRQEEFAGMSSPVRMLKATLLHSCSFIVTQHNIRFAQRPWLDGLQLPDCLVCATCNHHLQRGIV